jgi:hypothetical protein
MTEEDERYLVIGGRRWRRSDPAIPERLRSELVSELMAARRSVGAALRSGDAEELAAARRRVQDAKVALGERGAAWWDEPSPSDRAVRIRATIRTLLRHRDPATICPSDAARVVGGISWRSVLPIVRQIAADMSSEGEIAVRQRGADLEDPLAARGPVRLAFDQSNDGRSGRRPIGADVIGDPG